MVDILTKLLNLHSKLKAFYIQQDSFSTFSINQKINKTNDACLYGPVAHFITKCYD